MPVLLILVGLAVLFFTVRVALGHHGELSAERPDYAPLDLGPVSAADVALLRPPSNGWGYSKQATDEALGRIAESVRERDVRIVALEQLVTDLSRDPEPVTLGEPLPGARHRREVDTAELPALEDGTEPAAQSPAAPTAETERGYDSDTSETGEPVAEAGVSEPDTPETQETTADPRKTTLPQPALEPQARIWPKTPGMPHVTWPNPPGLADPAEETTAPQPAISDETAGTETGPQTGPQIGQPVRERGGQPERRRQEPPPEQSHG